MRLRNLVGIACLAGLAACSTTRAGQGYFDGDDLVLYVYFDGKMTEADLIGSGRSWKTYFLEAAEDYFDAHETKSRIKRIYLYNSLPEGLPKADVRVSTRPHGSNPNSQTWPSANMRAMGGTGNVNFGKNFPVISAGNDHWKSTFAHELAHYIYGIADSYGGQLEVAATGEKLPLHRIPANVPYRLPGGARVVPDDHGYRTYMWSDSWLRAMVPGVLGTAGAGNAIFYEPSGRITTPIAGSIMSSWINNLKHSEFSTPASTLGVIEKSFKMPAYEIGVYVYDLNLDVFGIRKRPADEAKRKYKLYNQQYDENRQSEWETVRQYHQERGASWTIPTSFSDNPLPTALLPEVILVNGAAVALCIDRSGSMTEENRMALAKRGGRAAIAQFRTRDADGMPGLFGGLVSFANSATVNASLQETVDNTRRTQLGQAVDALTASGNTAIGDGLRASLNALLAHPTKSKAIILLSDGIHNTGENPFSVIPDLIEAEVIVNTIAVGSGADTATLAAIANLTGGVFRNVGASDLTRTFISLFNKLNGAGTEFSPEVSLSAGETYEQNFFVEPSASRFVVLVDEEVGDLSLGLRRPDGSIATVGAPGSDVVFFRDGTLHGAEVKNPGPGDWKLVLDRADSEVVGPFARVENPPLPILDQSTITSDIQVTQTGTVSGLRVGVDVRHSYVGDMTLTLTSPAGTSVVLHNRSGGSTDNLVGTYGESLASAQALSAFDGQALQGRWRLAIQDSANGDEGTLNSWRFGYGGDLGGSASILASISVNSPEILVEASVSPATGVTAPAPFTIQASLLVGGGGVAGARVMADIMAPDGSITRLPLHDSGLTGHGDETPEDGIYTNLFSAYSANGTYAITVRAENIDGHLTYTSDVPPPGESGGGGGGPVEPFVRTVSVQTTVTGLVENSNHWFNLTSLSSNIPAARSGKQTLTLKGTFNQASFAPFDVGSYMDAVTIGSHAWNFSAGGWRQVRRLPKYTYTNGNVSAVLDVFRGGSSRCDLSFKVVKQQDLADLQPSPAITNIKLSTSEFEDGVNVLLNSRRGVTNYARATPQPEFVLNAISVKRVLGKLNGDQLMMQGGLVGPITFNPDIETLEIGVGPFSRRIQPGSFKRAKGGVLVFSETRANSGKTTVRLDRDRGLLTVTATRVDLASVNTSDSLPIRVSIGTAAQTSWLRNPRLSGNAARTVFTY